jgi:hypothetical protein
VGGYSSDYPISEYFRFRGMNPESKGSYHIQPVNIGHEDISGNGYRLGNIRFDNTQFQNGFNVGINRPNIDLKQCGDFK